MNYLIIGTDKYQIDQQLNKIIKDANIEVPDMNITFFDAHEQPLSNLIEACTTYPFFGEKKIVVIKRPYFLTAMQPKLSFEQDLDILTAYLNKPMSTTDLVFLASYDKLDERKKIVKLVKKESKVTVVEKISMQNIQQTVDHFLIEKQIKMDQKCKQLFCSRVAMDSLSILNELEKLNLYGGEITQDIIRQLVSKRPEEDVFQLVSAVLTRHLGEALSIYYDMLIANEEPIKMMVLIGNQIRLLYQVKVYQQKGYQQKDIATILSVHPYRIKLALEQTYQFSSEILASWLLMLSDLDYQIKQGIVEKNRGLELCIIEMCLGTTYDRN